MILIETLEPSFRFAVLQILLFDINSIIELS